MPPSARSGRRAALAWARASAAAILKVVDAQEPPLRVFFGELPLSLAKLGGYQGELKGTLEGIVLGILAVRAAYGYEITAWLREQGFADIAEGTVYALLVRVEKRGFVDVEKVPSEKGPPRKVYSLNAQGQEFLDEFWRTWSFLSERLEQLHEGNR